MKKDLEQNLGFHKCFLLNVPIVEWDLKMNFLMVEMQLYKDQSLIKKYPIKIGIILSIIEKVLEENIGNYGNICQAVDNG